MNNDFETMWKEAVVAFSSEVWCKPSDVSQEHSTAVIRDENKSQGRTFETFGDFHRIYGVVSQKTEPFREKPNTISGLWAKI
jgi:hypothetical protein